MFRIDDPTAATSLPAPEAAGTEGYFTEGNPTAGTPATNVRGSWLNMIQEELRAVVVAGGLTPSKTTYTQLRDAIQALYKTGRLLRTLIYTNVGGVQYVSINGATPVTTGAATYMPSSSISFIDVEAQGGGGAGGGAANPSAGTVSLGSPGKSGSYGRSIFTSAQVGSSQAVTVGSGGTAVSGAAGNNGGSTSLGALLSSPGGAAGGPLNSQTPPTSNGNSGTSGLAAGANLVSSPGVMGSVSQAISASIGAVGGGSGGGTPFGPATPQTVGNSNGVAATTIGAGGSGIAILNGAGPASGGSGSPGI